MEEVTNDNNDNEMVNLTFLYLFIASLEKKRSNLEELIKQLKEQHKDYIHNLETEQEQSLNEQKTTLTNEKLQAVQQGNILGPDFSLQFINGYICSGVRGKS